MFERCVTAENFLSKIQGTLLKMDVLQKMFQSRWCLGKELCPEALTRNDMLIVEQFFNFKMRDAVAC